MRIEKKFDADKLDTLLHYLNSSSIDLSEKQKHFRIPNITTYDQFLHQIGFKDLISGTPVKRQHKIYMIDILNFLTEEVQNNKNEKAAITTILQKQISNLENRLFSGSSEPISHFYKFGKKITKDFRGMKILFFSLKNIYQTLKNRGVLYASLIFIAGAATSLTQENSPFNKNSM